MKTALRLLTVGLLPLLVSCGSGDTVNVSTTFISTTLATRSDFTISGCGSVGSTTVLACITPTAIGGKAYYAGVIVGTTNGLSLGPMIGTVEDPSKATAFAESELLTVDLKQQIKNTGNPTLGGPIPYPADDQAYLREFHIYFGWMDVTFTLSGGVPNGAVDGTHTFRQVMADISGTEYKKGDILYKASGSDTFKWCRTGLGCNDTTRPATPVVNAAIAAYSTTEAGNKTIPSFFMSPPSDATPVQVKQADLKAGTSVFTIDISSTLGIKFTSTGATWTTVDQIASELLFSAQPGSSTSGFTATITYTK